MRRFPTTLKHGFGIALLTLSLGTIALAQDRPEVFARGGAADNEAAPKPAANNTPVQAAADNDLVTSGPAEQADITVYGSVFAQVQETRTVRLKAGRNRVQLNGVAARYRTDSLRVVDANGPGTLVYRSATYQPANLTNDKLLLESVGKEVKAWRYTSKGQAEIRGTLKSVAGTALTIEQADGSTELVNTGDVTLLQTPQGLSNTASLVVEADATADGDYQVDFLYETDGITWSAKHSLIFDEEKSTVQSWEATVSLVNESGTSFKNATVRLLSGRVTQGEEGPGGGARMYAAASDSMRSPEAASVENVGDQKLYTIPGTVNLAAGQTRQVPLFNGKNVPVKRTYVVGTASPRAYYSADGKQDAQIRLTVENCGKHNLGSPLPGGLVKVYQYNSAKKLQLTGSTRVSDKATDEIFDLNIGTSSDIKWDVKLVDSVVVKDAQKADPAGDGANVGDPNVGIGGNGAIGPRRATTPGRVAPTYNQQDGNKPEFSDRTYEVTVYNYKKDRAVEVKVELAIGADQNLEPKWLRPRRDRAETKLTVPQSDKASVRYILREQTR